MMDYIHLSATTPWGESCAQVGSEQYMHKARIEAHAFIDQLTRTFGNNPNGTCFTLVRCPHDFGTYLDIKFFYDDEDQKHVDYMSQIESGCEMWDELALAKLNECGYKPDNEQDEITSECGIPADSWEEFTTHDNGPTGHGNECFSDADPGL